MVKYLRVFLSSVLLVLLTQFSVSAQYANIGFGNYIASAAPHKLTGVKVTRSVGTVPSTDLSVTKVPDNLHPNVGSNVTFTITATNNGPDDATGVTVTDVPGGAGYSFVSETVTAGSIDVSTGIWTIGPLANGASATLTAVATVNANVPPTAYANTVTITGNEPDPVPGNNSATTTPTPIPQSDVRLTKTVDNATPLTGTNVTFTVTATDDGPSDVFGVQVTDLLPAGYTYVSSTVSGTTTYDNTTGLWDIGNIPFSTSATLIVTATVKPNQAGNYDNTATVTNSNQVDPNAGNNTAHVATTPNATDLVVTKTVNNPTPTIGSNVTFTVTLTNNGPGDATGVVVTDVPGLSGTGYTFVSVTPGTFNPSGIWTVGNLANGATLTSTIVATVNPNVAQAAYSNTVNVTGNETDPMPGNNSATVTTIPRSDIQLTKTVNNPTPNVGTNVIFTITATNAGPSDAYGVQVTDLLPAGYTYVSSTVSGTTTYNNGTGLWDIEALANTASATLTITATVKANQVGNYDNTANVTQSYNTDPTPGNNTAHVATTPTALTDLAVTKTADNPTPNIGSNVTFTVTVTNNGLSDATGVVVTDLPGLLGIGYTYVSVTPGTFDSSGKWNVVGALANGATLTSTIVATINPNVPQAAYANTVSVTGNETDPTPGNNTSTVTTIPQSDIQLTKIVDNPTPAVGANVLFTITATNAGPSDAYLVHVTDLLPAGYTYVSSTTSGTTSYDNTNGLWDIEGLPNGAVATLTITATVKPNLVGNYDNSATVTQYNNDPNTANNTAHVATTPNPVSDLSVTNTDAQTNYTPGVANTYTIVVSNAGPSDMVNGTLSVALPSGATGGSWTTSGTAGTNPHNATGTGSITGELIDIPSGGSITYTYTVTPSASTSQGTFAVTATVTAPVGTVDAAGNNSATDTDNPLTDLSITKIVSAPTPNVGTNVTFTLTATNNGPSDASGVNVTDLLPAGYTYVSSVPSTGTYTSGTGAWAIGAMVSGASATLTITATIVANQTGNYSNTATISGNETDPTPGNNSATAATIPVPLSDIALTKTVDVPTPNVGTNVTFTVTAINNGLSDATNVAVTDLLPAGYTFVSSVPSVGTYVSGTGLWTIGNLANTASATLAITATVKPDQAGSYDNTATVSHSDQTDPTVGNNTAHVATIPVPVSDLGIVVTDSKATYTPGTSNTYTVTVSNTGPSNVTGAIINNTFPVGGTTATWATSSSTGATATNPTGTGSIVNQTVNIPAGASIIYTYTINVPSSTTGTYSNTATVAVPTGWATDPTSGNNTSTDNDTQASSTDLSIAKTVSAPTPNVGTNVTFTLTATNNGPSDASGVNLADLLPAGYTYVSSVPSTGTYTSGTGVWAIGPMVSSATATLTITATVNANQTGNYGNTATISGNETDPTPGNNSATATTTPVPLSDIALTKTVDVPTPNVGTNVTFTVTATNNGLSDATNVAVTDLLPAGYTFVSSVPSVGTYVSGTGLWTIGAITHGTSQTLTVTATVKADQTGNYDNTATVSHSDQTDPTPGNNTAHVATIPVPVSDLGIVVTDSKATYTPGTSNTYTVTVSNTGPSNVTGAIINNTFPAGGTTATWATSSSTGATATNPTGTGSIVNQTVNIPAGASIIYTYTINVPSSTTGTYSNTATVAVPTGWATDPTPGNNTSTDNDTNNPVADLTITNTDGKTTYTPGTGNTYTVVVTNAGPTDAVGAIVTNPLPAGLTGTWAAVFTGGATGTATGSGDIAQTVNIPSGGTVTYTITATVPSSQTGNVVSTATVTVPAGFTDPTPGNNTATDTDTQNSVADLQITNTDGIGTYTAGTTTTYVVVAANTGPSNVTGATITDLLPAGVTGTWSITGHTGTVNTPVTSGTGNINQTVDMASGSTITYTIIANIASNVTGNVSTTATITAPAGVTDPALANNTATDTDTPNPVADLQITKTDGQATYTPGTTNTYVIVATNAGPTDVTGATITDALPTGATGLWTAVYTGGATGNANGTGNINQLVNIPKNGTVTYTYAVSISSATTGNFVNTATITVPAGTTDPTPANNTATDIDTYNPVADLSITNTDGKTTYTPGTGNTYTVVVTNNGPADVTGATVTNPLPAGLTGTWTAVFTGGATGTASGSGSIAQTVSIPSGGTITYTITTSIPSSQTGNVTSTATIVVPTGFTDPTPANNTATDVDTNNPVADLAITNTDSKTTYTAGTGNTYVVTVTNAGPTDAVGATVTNPLPAGLSGTWTAVFTGGATGTANGSGGIAQTVNIPSGGTITYTITASIPSSQTGNVVSAATVTAPAGFTDPAIANNTATDTDTPNPVADLSIANTDGKATYTPGTTNTYTVTVTNGGPTNITGATVSNPVPAGTTGTWTAVFTGGATGTATGTGDIAQTVNMPAGSTITYTVTVSISSTQTGNLVSTATVAVPAGYTDPTAANNTAIDTDTQSNVNDLQIVKTVSGATPSIGTQVTFTLTVTNNGPSAATGVSATDLLPTGYTYVSSAPSTGTYLSGTGVWAIGNLANAGAATMTIVATVNATGNYTNIATVTASGTDNTPANNTSQAAVTAETLPIANNDIATTIPATAVVIDILANDVKGFANLAPASVTIITAPAHGTVVIDPTTGKATYTPTAGYSGPDVFTYTVKDVNGGTSNIATVTITVTKPPVANNDNAITTTGLPITINILANDVQGSSNLNTSSVTIVQQPLHGVVSINLSTGAATYTPVTNYVGTDVFTYTVSGTDGAVSNAATVSITVNSKPIVGLAKFVAGVDKTVNGSFNVTYLVTVENFGVTALSSLSITDDLSQTFKGENMTVVSLKTLGKLTVNGLYNGNTVTEMLAAGNTLAIGDMQQIQVVVNVALVTTGLATYLNSATATGTDIAGAKATDVSTDGIKPDPNVAGDVSPAVPTPVQLTKPNEFIPGGFSPNNDGVNDKFVIENFGTKRMSLEVFNRWGNRVYHNTDYKNDWEAKSNDGVVVGQYLPDGTYYYVVSFDNAERRTGFITIHR